MRLWLFAGLLAALIGRGSLPAQAQIVETAGSGAGHDARWTHFTYQKDGLVSNSIHAIYLDGKVLWFGGEGGISSYNGLWETYTTVAGLDDTPGDVVAFAKDGVSGLLWAATADGQILQWNGHLWSLAVDMQMGVHTLAVAMGDLWIGGDEGLFRFDGVQTTLVDALGPQRVHSLFTDQGIIWVGADDGLWRRRDDRWLHIGANEPLFDAGVYTVLVGPPGEVFVGTPYGFGWRAREGAAWQSYDTYDEDGNPVLVRSLVVDGRTGVLWVTTDGAGVYAFDANRGTIENYGYTGDPNLTTRFVRQVVVDGDGSVWFATPAGVFRFQASLWQSAVVGEANDFVNHINDLLIARDGTVWAATAGGGVRRGVGADSGETIYHAADGADDAAYTLAQDIGGAIWTGGDLGLRRFTDQGWDAPIAQDKLPGSSVGVLLVDGRRLWIGADRGLAVLDVPTLSLTHEKALAGISVESLTLDSLGRLWAGTLANGIWLREGEGQWRQFTDDPSRTDRLPGNSVHVHGLAADPGTEGGVWAIVDGKRIVRWDGSRWRAQRESAPEPSDLLWALYTDPADGALWVGSEVGVTRYDGISWTTLGVQDGLQSANIYAIVGSAATGYWFGGRTGVSHFQPDRTPPWIDVALHTTTKARDDHAERVYRRAVALDDSRRGFADAADKMKVLYRQTGPGGTSAWTQMQASEPEDQAADAGSLCLGVLGVRCVVQLFGNCDPSRRHDQGHRIWSGSRCWAWSNRTFAIR